MPFPFGRLAVGGAVAFSVNFQDAAAFPVVTTGGTMSSAAFTSAAKGLVLVHAAEAAGVGMTIEAGPVAITSVTGSPGTLIQGNVARFGGRGATDALWGLRLEGPRTNIVQENYTGNPGTTAAPPWTDAGFGADTAVVGPDGVVGKATRSNIIGGQYSSYQTFINTNTPLQSQHVMSIWARATTNATMFATRLDFANLIPVVRNPAMTSTWQRYGVTCVQTIFPVTGGTSAVAGVVGLAEGGLPATACDGQWALAQCEINARFFSTPILNNTSAPADRHADKLQDPIAAHWVVNGRIRLGGTFVADGVFPYQYNTDDVVLAWKDANNWIRLSKVNAQGFGGYVVARIGGVIESIGALQWNDQDVVDIWCDTSAGLEVWYRLNGGNPILAGSTLLSSGTDFKGATCPSVGAMQLFNDGTISGFFGTVLSLTNTKPAWVPASVFRVNYTGQSVNTGAGSHQPFNAGDLAAAFTGGDALFVGTFTATEDWATTMANAIAAATDVWFLNTKTGGGDLLGFRWNHVNKQYELLVNGVVQPQIYGIAGNVQSWGTSGGQTDQVLFFLSWQPTLGRAGFRFNVNGMASHGFDGIYNLAYAYPSTPSYLSGTNYALGSVLVPSSGPNGLRARLTAGAGVSGIGLTTPSILAVAGLTYSTSNGQGTTFTDSNGLVFTAQQGEIAVGAGLASPTQCFLGSYDGTTGLFPALWSQFGWLYHGDAIEPPTTYVDFLGDSQTTSWLGYVPFPSRIRTVAEANGQAWFGFCGFPGLRFLNGGFATMWANSKYGLFAASGWMQGHGILGGTNDTIGGSTAPQISSDNQALITTTIRGVDLTSPIFEAPMPPERGGLSAGQYAVWQAATADQAGGGANPITDPIGGNIVYVPSAPQNNSTNNSPPVGADFLSADADAGDHEHENNVGRGGGVGRLAAVWRTSLNTKGLGLGG